MVKIKICGLWRPCDIHAVNAGKPDYVGFIFADSRRKVSAKEAFALRKLLLPGIIPVGVFVNESPDNILSLVRAGIIDVIQLHGGESEKYIEELKKLANKPVIKSVAPQNPGDSQKHSVTCADYLLFDQKGGGTGKVFNWDLIGEIKKPFFLAGGLNVSNIDEALQRTRPYAVDISSGVETDGFKDPDKIKSIIRKIRKIYD